VGVFLYLYILFISPPSLAILSSSLSLLLFFFFFLSSFLLSFVFYLFIGDDLFLFSLLESSYSIFLISLSLLYLSIFHIYIPSASCLYFFFSLYISICSLHPYIYIYLDISSPLRFSVIYPDLDILETIL
jgi:hypothetical protein